MPHLVGGDQQPAAAYFNRDRERQSNRGQWNALSRHHGCDLRKMHQLLKAAENKDHAHQQTSQAQPNTFHRILSFYWISKCSGCNRGPDFTSTVWPATSSSSCNHRPFVAFRALATSGLTRNITSRSK